jgi:hypothetical protein
VSRLRSLLDELDVDPEAEASLDPLPAGRGDPFFTAQVLAALPSRLAFTGLTPGQRVALLGSFHALAAALAAGVVWTFAPTSFAELTHHAHGWLDALGEAPWTWSLAAVVFVALVALAVTRSHTRPA